MNTICPEALAYLIVFAFYTCESSDFRVEDVLLPSVVYKRNASLFSPYDSGDSLSSFVENRKWYAIVGCRSCPAFVTGSVSSSQAADVW